MNMDRKALLLYIERIRDLEVMKYSIEQDRNSELAKFDQQIAVAKTPLPPITSSPQGNSHHDSDNSPVAWKLLIFIIADVLVLLVGILIIPNVALCIFSVLLLIVIIIVYAIKSQTDQYHEDFKRNIEDQQRWTEEQKRRTASIPVLQKQKDERKRYYDHRIDSINRLLTQYYSIHPIIPDMYHNVFALCFIYSFMSTSQFDLEYTVLHMKLDEIKASIDSSVERIRREIRALNENSIRSNISMLNKLDQSNLELRGIYSTMQSLETEFYHGSRNYF